MLQVKIQQRHIKTSSFKGIISADGPSVEAIFRPHWPAVPLCRLTATVRLRVGRLCILFVEVGEADLTPPNQDGTGGRWRRGVGAFESQGGLTGDGVTAAVGPSVTEQSLLTEFDLWGTERRDRSCQRRLIPCRTEMTPQAFSNGNERENWAWSGMTDGKATNTNSKFGENFPFEDTGYFGYFVTPTLKRIHRGVLRLQTNARGSVEEKKRLIIFTFYWENKILAREVDCSFVTLYLSKTADELVAQFKIRLAAKESHHTELAAGKNLQCKTTGLQLSVK